MSNKVPAPLWCRLFSHHQIGVVAVWYCHNGEIYRNFDQKFLSGQGENSSSQIVRTHYWILILDETVQERMWWSFLMHFLTRVVNVVPHKSRGFCQHLPYMVCKREIDVGSKLITPPIFT